jgi:ferredoxin-thioredoxin reductase catalytic subunit
MLKIIPNPNKEVYETETKAVKESGGYCPCRLVHNQDTKCVCKDFKEQKTEGLCYCERFMKVEV